MIKLDGAHDASDSLHKLLVEQGKADDQVRALRRLSTLGLGAAFRASRTMRSSDKGL